MMRPDTIQAITDAMAIAEMPNNPLVSSWVAMPAAATAVGRPTLTSHGARCAVV